VNSAGADRETLRRDLLALGFDEVRFADAEPAPKNRFRDWLDRGWHADMAWMERTADKRLDPRGVLEGASTVVLIGVNYLPDESDAAAQQRWAKYALYEDYHDTMIGAVREAAILITDRYGLGIDDCRGYVDTGPVMERGLAARSGMGWLGKNGMLISRQHGNWLFLAVLLVRARIEPDKSLAGGRQTRDGPPSLGQYCGSCTRCMDVCPTDAIREPGLVDSERCISYQTIENKGVIPRQYRGAIGSRIFGCDICLDVCPWNRFAQAGRRAFLVTRYDLAKLNLIDILTISPERFAEVFRHTPFKRLKRERLLRNACVVAGNLNEIDEWKAHLGGTCEDLEVVLVSLASSGSPLVRVHAIWAVYRLAPERAGEWLVEARSSEMNESVLEEYAWWGTKSVP
jgi:epoxyqueuosine reductase